MIPLLLLLLCTPLLAEGPAFRVLGDEYRPPIRARGVVGRATTAMFREEALRVLAPNDIGVGSFVVYASEADRIRAAGQGGTDCNYKAWSKALDHRGLTEKPSRCPQVTQAIKLDDTIVMRGIDAQCHVEEALLQGAANPLRFSLSGTMYELLDVIASPVACRAGVAKHPCLKASFYVKTDGIVTKERAKEVLLYLQKLGGVVDASVALRNDAWFITECEFPVFLAFIGLPKSIPGEREFLSTSQAFCLALTPWPVQCH